MKSLNKILLTQNYNELIYAQTDLGHDYLDCSFQTCAHIDYEGPMHMARYGFIRDIVGCIG